MAIGLRRRRQAPHGDAAAVDVGGDGLHVIRFKYTSQNTFDRPSASYLVEIVKRLVD